MCLLYKGYNIHFIITTSYILIASTITTTTTTSTTTIGSLFLVPCYIVCTKYCVRSAYSFEKKTDLKKAPKTESTPPSPHTALPNHHIKALIYELQSITGHQSVFLKIPKLELLVLSFDQFIKDL